MFHEIFIKYLVQRKLGRQTRVQGVSQLHVTVKYSEQNTKQNTLRQKILQDVGSDLRHSKPLHVQVMDP